MKVILNKEHNGEAAGTVQDRTPEEANYLVRCKVAEYADGLPVVRENPIKPTDRPGTKELQVQKKTKELKIDLETK
jgi:hypothetical protein